MRSFLRIIGDILVVWVKNYRRLVKIKYLVEFTDSPIFANSNFEELARLARKS